MIGITRAAQRQIDDLIRFYLFEKDRPEAAERLLDDLERAKRLILGPHTRSAGFPGPYADLEMLGFRWIRVRAYWIGFVPVAGHPVVTNVFHVTADIERRAVPGTDDVIDW
jgi:plasmid stabilization system protein ParE